MLKPFPLMVMVERPLMLRPVFADPTVVYVEIVIEAVRLMVFPLTSAAMSCA